MEIRRATPADADAIAPLFDAYRQFYRFSSDLMLARRFIAERLANDESVIFLADEGGTLVGFTQLYPSFSSGSAARIFVLNDLFVAPEARKTGVGAALLDAAREFGAQSGAVRLTLSTEVTNAAAQSLYEAQGWVRDRRFCHYELDLPKPGPR